MKSMCPLWIVVGSAALLHVGGRQAVAQIELGAAASVSNVQGGTFGLGGRLGVPVRESTNGSWRLEAAVDYFWPSCALTDCNATGAQLDVVFQDRTSGWADPYFGAGATYQSFTLERDDLTPVEGNVWGANFVVGSRYVTQTALRPFLEIRWTVLDGRDNQWALFVGTTVALGR